MTTPPPPISSSQHSVLAAGGSAEAARQSNQQDTQCVCEAVRAALASCPPSITTEGADQVLLSLKPVIPALVAFTRQSLEGAGETVSQEYCLRALLPQVAAALTSLECRPEGLRRVELVDDSTALLLEAAQEGWLASLADELRAIAEEQGRPVAMLRERETDSPHLAFRHPEPVLETRFLYDSDDLYDAVKSLALREDSSEGFKSLLRLPSIAEMFASFVELNAGNLHLAGADDPTDADLSNHQSRLGQGEQVLALGTPSDVRMYLRFGCPACLRSRVWRRALGLCPQKCSYDTARYAEVTREWHRVDLVCDEMVASDVRLVAEDPSYFVFEVRPM